MYEYILIYLHIYIYTYCVCDLLVGDMSRIYKVNTDTYPQFETSATALCGTTCWYTFCLSFLVSFQRSERSKLCFALVSALEQHSGYPASHLNPVLQCYIALQAILAPLCNPKCWSWATNPPPKTYMFLVSGGGWACQMAPATYKTPATYQTPVT